MNPARPARDPRDPFVASLDAYKAAFNDSPAIFGCDPARLPALAKAMDGAVTRGRALTEAEVCKVLGVAPLPPGALA